MSKDEKLIFKFLALSFISILIIMFFVMTTNMQSSETDEVISTKELNKPFNSKIKYIITSEFGGRNSPLGTGGEFHNGIDIAIPKGTEVLASGSGYVVSYKFSNLTGETVILEHNIDNKVYRTHYYHMLENSVVVAEGQKVNVGQKIGIVGMSGSQVTGVHLHFEVRTYNEKSKKFTPIDPSYVLQK